VTTDREIDFRLCLSFAVCCL